MKPAKHNHSAKSPSCCGGKESHDHHGHACCGGHHAPRKLLPMCPGVESDDPATVRMQHGLERNPTWKPIGQDNIHLPDAPGVRNRTIRRLPEVRHGAGTKPAWRGAEDGRRDDNAELRDMTRRFQISTALTLPVFLLAMAHLIPSWSSWADGDASRWTQFVLSIPVVGWAAWPFFRRGWRSLLTGNLNMFTLIAIGVGAAFHLQRGSDARPRRVSAHDEPRMATSRCTSRPRR